MKRPNFIYVGAAKSGSTWLFNLLNSHPNAFLSYSKELYFFDKYYDRGMDWYLSNFRGAENESVVGEISHDYLYDEQVPQRIKEALGADVKILCFLREPIDKMYSSYSFRVRNGLMDCSFEDALSKDPELIRHVRYGQFLERYIEVFGKNVGVFFYDDLKSDPVEFGRSVLSFLGLEDIQYDYAAVVNKASQPRVKLIAFAAKKLALMARDYGFQNIVSFVKRSAIVRKILYKRSETGGPLAVDPALVDVIVRLFHDDIHKLDEMLEGGVAERWPHYFG